MFRYQCETIYNMLADYWWTMARDNRGETYKKVKTCETNQK